jgi:hypothetical protein
MTMISTRMSQGLAAEHRRELVRSADSWRTLRAAVVARREAAKQRRLLAELAAAARATPLAPAPSATAPRQERAMQPASVRR